MFAADMTVEQVRQEYTDKPGGLLHLVVAISVQKDPVTTYIAAVVVFTIDELLARAKVVRIDGPDEAKTFKDRRVQGGVVTARRVLEDARDRDESRAFRLCHVVGPTGSGKTFFALVNHTNFLNSRSEMPSVALYVKVPVDVVVLASRDATE